MYEIDGVFTMKERIRATVCTAGLALFLLAACSAQEALDENEQISEGHFTEIEAPQDIDADTTAEEDASQEALSDEEIADINLIIKDTADISSSESEAADTASDSSDTKKPADTQSQTASESKPAEIGSAAATVTKDEDAQVVETDLKQADWFKEQGKKVTALGKFKLVTSTVSDDFKKNIAEKQVDCIMDITSAPSDREGYKTIIATLMLDCDDGLVWEMIPFDRYTGVAMIIHRLGNGKNGCEGNVTVAEKTYDVEYTVDIGRGSDGRASSVYKVTVPEDYDGLMFYVGYANAQIAAEDDKYLSEAMMLSDMPSWGSPSEFFFEP